jgi:acetyl esterase/lipase
MTHKPEPDRPAHEPVPIDAQFRPFIADLMQSRAPDVLPEASSFAEMRRRAELVRAPWRRGGPVMAATVDARVPTAHGDVPARLYQPRKHREPRPALIYLHGGGWTTFSIQTHDLIMRELAARAGILVVGVDYALSPEAKFPHALHQIRDVVHWLAGPDSWPGIDTARLAIGGDSAGANLAVATSLMLRDAGHTNAIRGMLLAYGCFTSELSETSTRRYGSENNLLSSREMTEYWENYLADPADARSPLACPLLARLEGLPPAFQIIAQCDVLAEQNAIFAQRLRAAGVPVEAREYTGAPHSFLEAVSVADVAGHALDDAAAWLRECLRVS